jgi:predicted outer membrane protein
MKITNLDASKILSIYAKVMHTDLESQDFDLGYNIATSAVELENKLKTLDKIKDASTKKLQGLQENSPEYIEVVNKVNKEITEAFNKEIEIDKLTALTKDFIVKNKIKLTAYEILKLKEYKLFD